MKLLIDGYNLMYAANITGAPGQGTSLFRSRLALLRQLANRLTRGERAATTIVFDARQAPPGLPKQGRFESIEVLFADRRQQADDLMIELIDSSSHARDLTVVSSDHRIQRAARRKGATAVDSDQWWKRLRPASRSDSSDTAEPLPALDEHDLRTWLESCDGTMEELERALEDNRRAPPSQLPLENPFPPGYAEDLLEDEED